MAECCFVDPVADLAVLTSPDNQEMSDEAHHYEALMEASVSLPIADALEDQPGWLLSLSGLWFKCTVEHFGGPLWISKAAEGIVGGMSGSPILSDDGLAIGVVVTDSDGPSPHLTYDLPARLFRGT